MGRLSAKDQRARGSLATERERRWSPWARSRRVFGRGLPGTQGREVDAAERLDGGMSGWATVREERSTGRQLARIFARFTPATQPFSDNRSHPES